MAIVTMEYEQEFVHDLSNGAISNDLDLEWTWPQRHDIFQREVTRK